MSRRCWGRRRAALAEDGTSRFWTRWSNGFEDARLNEHLIHQMVHDNSNAIVRFTGLDESISNRIVAGLSKLLSEMAVDETHPAHPR